MNSLINYILDGIVGGILYIIVSKLGYDQRWDIIRRLLTGAIAGYIIFLAGLPDHLAAIGLGYVGIDSIEAILIKNKLIESPHQYQSKTKNE